MTIQDKIREAHFKRWVAASFAPLAENQWVSGQSFRQYVDSPGINASSLKYDTPQEMKFWAEQGQLNPYEINKEDRAYNFALGEALHKAVLEPDIFDLEGGVEEYFQYAPEGPRGGEGLTNKNAIKAYAADPSRPLVTQEIIDKARFMRDKIYSTVEAAKLLRVPAEKELSGYCQDPDSNCIRKIRMDFCPLNANYNVDLKTALSVKPTDFWRMVLEKRYHFSAAYYIDAQAMIDKKPPRELFFFIAVTGPKAPSEGVHDKPYQCQVFEIAGYEEKLSLVVSGREKYQMALGKFCNAVRNWDWEGYEHAEYIQLTTLRPQ